MMGKFVLLHTVSDAYYGKPEGMYLQQIDHLIGKMKMTVVCNFSLYGVLFIA